MKKENKVLIAGLVCAALVSISVFVPWKSIFDMFTLGNAGHFLSNEVYNTYIFAVIVYFIVLVCRHREYKGAFLQGIIILLVLTVFHISIKLLFGQWTLRPSGHSGGFPSGHSQAVFALAFLISVRNTKLTFPSFVIAMLLAWSRIFSAHYHPDEAYEPAHYPYQVCFGSFFGVVLTYFMYNYLEPRREKILSAFCRPFYRKRKE